MAERGGDRGAVYEPAGGMAMKCDAEFDKNAGVASSTSIEVWSSRVEAMD